MSKENCNGCSGCGEGNNSASIAAQMAELSETVKELQEALAPFLNDGHPIVLIQHADDIDLFDFVTGRGSGAYQRYAMCTGGTHKNSKNKNITTPNWIDRFVVMAGGTYAVDDTGGSATVSLTISEMPAHTHVINDPQHTHLISDPGHLHAVDDPGHLHAASGGAHVHGFTTDADGNHTHQSLGSMLTGPDDGSLSAPNLNVAGTVFADHQPAGNHTHTGITDAASGSVAVDSAFTGIATLDAFTGITNDPASTGITLDNAGSGDSHENLPPYFAAVYIMYLG
jgi:microcystin-dependent protein